MNGNDVLVAAVREIGYREGKGKSNKFGAWYGMNGAAWCMMFVQWCYDQAGAPLPCRTASCGALLRWYKANQPECITKNPVPGCVVIFDFPGGADTDHTGLFVSRTADTVTTIDGNTGDTSQSNGGWVQQKTRKTSYAKPIYIVPRCLGGGQKEETMTGKEIYEKLTEYLGAQSAPDWAKAELAEAVELGITDGTAPQTLIPRYQAAIMAKRAAQATLGKAKVIEQTQKK